ncbi:MAG: ComF family protein [Bacteroidetes bacterium]|nr:ComF family protein [Bacteroidota bacterium]
MLQEAVNSFSHIFFPHICVGCGTDLIDDSQLICLHCMHKLPVTHFELHANNPIEKIFWGRAPIQSASAQYYFTKNSILQQILHQFKYEGKKQIGTYFGKIIGETLSKSNRFNNLDALVPLPLFASKERKRGYNQATVLADGISSVIKVPVLNNCIERISATETQTLKNRMERWHNISGKFRLKNKEHLIGKHILLVDDVITTGATLDACANEFLKEEIRVSIVTLACAQS